MVSISLQKYTNAYSNKNGKKSAVGKIILGLLTSPDYSFSDIKAIMINGYRKNNSIWKEILKIDLSEILKNVEMPYIILQGDTDIVASTRTVEELVLTADNPMLKCKVIKNTGHFPGEEMMEQMFLQLSPL